MRAKAVMVPSVKLPCVDYDGSLSPARNSKVLGSYPRLVGCFLLMLCIYIQCSKLFKGLESVVLSTVMCTIKNPLSHSIRIEHSPELGLPSVALRTTWYIFRI